MQRNVNYLAVTAMIILAALMSCNKDDKRPSNDECVCIHTDNSGVLISSNENISDEMLKTLNFIMFPNPTSEVVYLMFKTADMHIVSVTDKRGKVLFDQSFDTQIQTIMINVFGYSAGEYRVSVDNGKQKSCQTLIKVDKD